MIYCSKNLRWNSDGPRARPCERQYCVSLHFPRWEIFRAILNTTLILTHSHALSLFSFLSSFCFFFSLSLKIFFFFFVKFSLLLVAYSLHSRLVRGSFVTRNYPLRYMLTTLFLNYVLRDVCPKSACFFNFIFHRGVSFTFESILFSLCGSTVHFSNFFQISCELDPKSWRILGFNIFWTKWKMFCLQTTFFPDKYANSWIKNTRNIIVGIL